jgi:hypothetical protein
MKRSELKAMIKECVKEALFEEGVLKKHSLKRVSSQR